MDSGGNFGPELLGSFPTSAAEKQNPTSADVCDCNSFESDHPSSPSFPQMLRDAQAQRCQDPNNIRPADVTPHRRSRHTDV